MAKQHSKTLKFEAYLVGKLANVIWGENWTQNILWTIQPRCHLGK
jgi:hypothetical protein